MKIELGYDGKYYTQGIGDVTFNRESSSHLHLTNVMYVSRLKKNLISIARLEDRGYDVVLSKGKSLLKNVSTIQVKHIGVRVKNIYKLEPVDFTMHASIPPRVRWGNVEPQSQCCKDFGRVHRRGVAIAVYSSHGSLPLLHGPVIFSSRRINFSWRSQIQSST